MFNFKSCHANVLCALGLAAVLAGNVAASASADSVEDFYKGKKFNLLVGVAAGGDYDFKMRLVGKHIGSFIPGHPTVVPQNMLGATGLTMANYLFRVAPKDGTYMGLIQNGLSTFQAVGMPGAQFEPAEFNWIGSMAPSVETMAVYKTASVRTIQEARAKEVVVGAVGTTGISTTFPKMLNELIGTKFKIIGGYPGAGAVNLAMERGEVEARSNAWSAWKTANGDWLRSGDLLILLYSGRKPNDLNDVPSLQEYLKSDEDKALVNLVTAGSQLGHPFAMPPGVPADRLAAVRKAFTEMLKSPGFIKDAEAAKSDIDPVSAEELQRVAESLGKTPEHIKQRAKALLE